jgi:mannosyl-oligosaccharide glucosidase
MLVPQVMQLIMHHLRISSLLTSLLYATGILASQDPNDVSVLIKEAARANNESLLWGPYKPNLYFGVRPRIANSLAAGLMWAKVDDFATVQQSMLCLPSSSNCACMHNC